MSNPGLDILDCRRCPHLLNCCNGEFTKAYRVLLRPEEALNYGPHLAKRINPGVTEVNPWLAHEHIGSCPHRNPSSGLCALHFIGKPDWCSMCPISFDESWNVVLEPLCVPMIKWESFPEAVAWVKKLAKKHPPYHQQLLQKAKEITSFLGGEPRLIEE